MISVDDAYKLGKRTALSEMYDVIHDIYAYNLYCMEDYCESEEKGYNCIDCLYSKMRNSIMDKLKEQKQKP